MAYHHEKNGTKDSSACSRCGRPIKVIGQQGEIPLLMLHGSEQRGFQCVVCGRITCFDCSDNRYRCLCGGNAWIARVYENGVLQSATMLPLPEA